MLLHFALSAVLTSVPHGYVIECRSCPPQGPINLVVRLVATDDTKFTTGVMKFSATPQVAQDALVAAIEDSGFVARRGENDTVILLGPKGKSIKSVSFESSEWAPVYKLYFGK